MEYVPPITIGKIYETDELPDDFKQKLRIYDIWIEDAKYKIINDNGFSSWELIENFITLEEWREQQLNKII
jgi:hypothetical protein